MSWSRSQLLMPFCWWPVPADGVIAESASARADSLVSLIVDGEPHEMLLGLATEDTDPEAGALIAAYPAGVGEVIDAGFARSVERSVHIAAGVMPFRPGQAAEACMVVIPAEIAQPVPPELFNLRHVPNIYVAPEDRADPDDPNLLVDNAPGFPPHAAHAIATLADLWIEGGESQPVVIPAFGQRQSGLEVAHVEVMRCYSRAIDYGYLADRVSAGVFQVSSAWPNPDRTRYDRVRDPEPVVRHVVDRYMAKHRQVLGRSEFDPIVLEPPRPFKLLEALWILVRDLVRGFRRKPFELVQDAAIAVHNRVADWVLTMAGPDSDITRAGIERWGRGKTPVEALPDLLERLASYPRNMPDGPTRQTWRDLQTMPMALVDGSPLPDGIDPGPITAGTLRAVVTRPEDVVPHPASEAPFVPGVDAPRACDPAKLDPSFAPAAVSPEADAEGAWTQEDLDALVEWSAPHRRTPVWMIGLRIAQALGLARAEAAAALPSRPDAAARHAIAQQRAQARAGIRRRLLRTAGLGTIAAVIAVAIVWGALSTLLAAGASVVVVLAWLLAVASASQSALEGEQRLEREELQGEIDALNAMMLKLQRTEDAKRLAKRYEEYLDWAEIVGWFVHKPWVGMPLDRVMLPPAIDRHSLPAAFNVAVGNVTDESLGALSATAQRKLFQAGWLASLYRDVEDGVMTSVTDRTGDDGSPDEPPDPAADMAEDELSLRHQLRVAVRRGDGRAIHQNPLTQDLLRFLNETPLRSISGGVAVGRPNDTEDGVQPLAPSAAWLERPADLDALVERVAPAVVRVEPEGIVGSGPVSGAVVGTTDEGAALVAVARHAVDGASRVAVVLADGSRIDAEPQPVAADADLAILSMSEGPALRALRLPPQGFDFREGEPIVAIGRTPGAYASPFATWGLVVARSAGSGFRAVYHPTGRTPGAVVVTLEGYMVGMHCAGERRNSPSDGVTAAVAFERVVELVSTPSTSGAGLPPSGPAESTLGVRTPHAPRRRPQLVETSVFMEELGGGRNEVALLPQHWNDPNGAHVVNETLPDHVRGVDPATPLARLAGDTHYLRPARVLIHRVDMTRPVTPGDLRSCR
jgi:hypothetical protein